MCAVVAEVVAAVVSVEGGEGEGEEGEEEVGVAGGWGGEYDEELCQLVLVGSTHGGPQQEVGYDHGTCTAVSEAAGEA